MMTACHHCYSLVRRKDLAPQLRPRVESGAVSSWLKAFVPFLTRSLLKRHARNTARDLI
jgi:hypothetical protein